MSDRDRRIDGLFERVLDAPPGERESILESAGELRDEVESLVRAHQKMGADFLAMPAAGRLDRPRREPGDRVGRYTIRRTIASGGSGTVYEAEQDQPHRLVALKVMHTGLASGQSQRRFTEEAEILARLEHPGIAHVYEAGVEEGEPFIAMELLAEVRTLTEHADSLDRRQRLELFAEVCDAIHHGHQLGIIHRDLKPANVLVKAGRPRIVDFGIARAMGRDDDEIAGTVPYMSPEQCTSGAHLDVRSDVYSLGVLLYELLQGDLPYDVPTTSITDAARVIREVAPCPLGISPDLDAVVGKALAKDPGARYGSAAALAEDVLRYRAREPVRARRAGPLHRLLLFVRRAPALSAALVALAVVLVAGTAFSVRFAIRADQGRRRAEQESYRATVVAADAALRINDVEGARSQLALSPPHLRGWEWRYLMAETDGSERSITWPGMMIYTGRVSAGRPRAIATSGGGVRVWDVATGEVLCDVPRAGPLQTAAALSPDGERFLIGNEVGEIEIRNTATGVLVAEVAEETQIWVLAWSPDGRCFAAGTMGGALTIRNADGSPVRTIEGRDGAVMSMAFFPDGRRIAAGGEDAAIQIHDQESGKELRRLLGHRENVESLALSPSGDLLVSGAFDGAVRLWDPETGECLKELRKHTKGVKAVAFAPDGRSFASGALDHTVRLHRRDGSEIAVLRGHSTMIRGLGYTPDSSRLVSFGRDDTLKVWNALRRGPGTELAGLDRSVRQIAFGDDGDIVGVSRSGVAIVWEGETGREVTRLGRPGAGVLLSSGTRLVSAHPVRGVSVVPIETGAEAMHLGRLEDFRPYCIVADAGAERVAIGENTGRISIWRLDGGGAERSWRPGTRTVTALAISPDDTLLAAASQVGPVSIWRMADGKKVKAIPVGNRPIRSLAFSPDGRTLAAGGERGALLLLDVEGRTVRARLKGHNLLIFDLAYSPDGARIASASSDGTVRIWDARHGAQLIVLRGHQVHATAVAFGPDGRRLATGGGDHTLDACTIRVWEAPPGN